MDIIQTLIKKSILAEKDASVIREEAQSLGITIEESLIKHGISSRDILEAKGEYFGVPTKNIDNVDIPGKVLDYIPEDSAMHYRLVPLGVVDGVLEVGMVDPDDIEAHDALNFISSKAGMPFKIFLISREIFEKIIALYKGLSGEVSKSLSDLETELQL